MLILITLAETLFAGNQYFIENKGQWSDEVKYLAKTGGMNAWITKDAVVYDFYLMDNVKWRMKNEQQKYYNSNTDSTKSNIPIKGHVVKMSFVNSKLSESFELSESYGLEFQGINKSETYYNYFLGNDSTKWANHVALYDEVEVKQILRGINIKYYFDNGNLRYDYIIEPGGDISQLKMDFVFGNDCQYYCTINSDGELVLNTSIGEIVNGKVYAYQIINEKKHEVNCKFQLENDNQVGFKIEDYNPEFAIVIDPLVYSTFIGGSYHQISLLQSGLMIEH
jgi:hypothetical protein